MEFLVRELAELREMLVGIKRTVTGHGLEEKGGETVDREVGMEEQEKGKDFWHQTRERLGQKKGRRYVLAQRLWQPTHIRGTLRAL